MRGVLARYRDFYGSHPLHLLTMLAGFALLGYIIATVRPVALWNPQVWWQSIAVWFAAAIIAHDLVLFPVYALADRMLTAAASRKPKVAALNYIRIPALASSADVRGLPARHHRAGQADIPGGDRTDAGAVSGQVAAADGGAVRHQRGAVCGPGRGRPRQAIASAPTTRSPI